MPGAPDPQGGRGSGASRALQLDGGHAGKLLVRVREPLLATDPPLLGRVPGFYFSASSTLGRRRRLPRAGWTRAAMPELSDEEVAAPLCLNRAVHSTVPEEMVRVHLYLYRGDKEEPWLDFYQCRPAVQNQLGPVAPCWIASQLWIPA